MSEEEITDVRAIALVRLVREFQRTYMHWLRAWAELKSYQKAKRLLKGFETHCEGRGWKLGEDVREEIEEEIADINYHIDAGKEELCRHYANLERVRRRIAEVLDEPWEWRDGSEVDAEWMSRPCPDLE